MYYKNANIKNIYELAPVYGNKSFYNRAWVIELRNGVKLLKSYETIVAVINTKGAFCRIWGGWSATTAKHLSAFAYRYANGNGYNGKAEWLKMPINERNVKAYAPYARVETKAYAPTMYGCYCYWY